MEGPFPEEPQHDLSDQARLPRSTSRGAAAVRGRVSVNVGPLAWAVRVVRREQRPLARASTEMTAVTTRTAATSAGRRRVTGGNDLITLVTAPRAWGPGGCAFPPRLTDEANEAQ